MSRPQRYLTRMTLFVVGVILVCAILAPGLVGAFLASPVLNGVIVALTLLGIGYAFRLVFALRQEVAWLERIRSPNPDHLIPVQPRLLAPLAAMIGQQRGRLTLSALSLRSVLDGISGRMGEQREITRYLIGLSIFLGLLGTFWGLLQTISSVAAVIGELSLDSGDISLAFSDLQNGLAAPLSGMGTAFSSSLFGLSGSLILGFMELQSGQAQNRFYNELEDWLSGAVQLTSGGAETVDAKINLPAYLRALVERTSENLAHLEATMTGAEERSRQTNAALSAMTEQLAYLNTHLRQNEASIAHFLEEQGQLRPVIDQLGRTLERASFGEDAATREHIRSIEAHLARLVEEQGASLDRVRAELSSEINLLTRTIANLAQQEAALYAADE